MVQIYKTEYSGGNFSHFNEFLEYEHNKRVSQSFIYKTFHETKGVTFLRNIDGNQRKRLQINIFSYILMHTRARSSAG